MATDEINPNIRKFIDLVRQTSGKWANWDPPIPIDVGDYGNLDHNGELVVEGNIYNADFQECLDDNNINISLKDHPAEYGPPEQDYIVASTGVKKRELQVDVNASIPPLASATIKGTWQFRNGKRGALIILYRPRQKYIPKYVQTKILQAKVLEGKKVVLSALACPAYLQYLSDKSGENISVAFSASTVGNVPSGTTGIGWWTNNESALLRRAFHSGDDHRFIPLFALGQKARSPTLLSGVTKWFRGDGEESQDFTGEYMWQEVRQPWAPLDEDGNELD